MTTTMRLLPVRTTPTLRAVIDRTGPVNAATRALIVLGAHTAGLDLRGCVREIVLLLAEDLEPGVWAALHRLYSEMHAAAAHQGLVPTTETLPAPEPAASAVEQADPFASIGVEV